jgi:Ankyrin repeat
MVDCCPPPIRTITNDTLKGQQPFVLSCSENHFRLLCLVLVSTMMSDNPLVSAIYNGRFVRTMRTTVRNDPSLIRQKDTEGRLPLHHAARHSAPLPVVRFLVRWFEAALLEKNGDVYLPLHFAAQQTS